MNRNIFNVSRIGPLGKWDNYKQTSAQNHSSQIHEN